MRVLHLCTSDVRGGAARGAYSLHRKLREKGVDSRMLVGRKHSGDPTVAQLRGAFAPFSERVRGRLDLLPLRRYNKTDESFWSISWQPRRLSGALAAFEPDLVHVQWTGGGFLPIEALRDVQVPIVWTLRDMWAFTGGCHYTAGCGSYITGCGSCPQLRSKREDDLSRTVVTRKRRAWQDLDLWLVPISEWMARRAKESYLFSETPATVIPNGIDTTQFRPVDKRQARVALGLPVHGRYILFSALNALEDTRKGFWHLAKALGSLRSRNDYDPPQLIVAGDMVSETAPELPIKTRFLGWINDNERLASLYAAADVAVAPSLQEAFGKVHVEAMACATPVVAFDSGGPREIVQHKRTGYLATPFDPEDLARGLDWCLGAVASSGQLGEAARSRAQRKYDIGVVAERYIDLYREILEGENDRSAA